MNDTVKTMFKPLASLKLTVLLMAVSIVLIFAGTWAQIDKGIWRVMSEYFRCWLTFIDLQIFLPRHWHAHVKIPWPGGYLIAVVLLVNLIAAHSVRFKFTWKRSGIFLIHGALILLLVGEGITSIWALETQMPIYEGQTSDWAHDIREVELAVVDHSDPQRDTVVVIPQSWLKRYTKPGRIIRDHRLPFDIKVERFMTNSKFRRLPSDGSVPALATAGVGLSYFTEAIKEVSGVSEQTVNFPAAVLALTKNDRNLGRYLVTPHIQSDYYQFQGQDVVVDDKVYSITLRFRRYYKPYTIHLTDFSHDLYTGTTIPKNFSSDIHLVDPARNENRKVKIYMNHPLRYHGETFFQSGWIPDDSGGPDRGTVLQLVDNPGWTIPYVACSLGGLGLLIHFGMHLIQFLRRNAYDRP